MGYDEYVLTPEFKEAITRCTWDSRVNPTVVTVWVGDLPVFTRPMGFHSMPYDTLTISFEGGYKFEAENLDPRAHRPEPFPFPPQRLRRWPFRYLGNWRHCDACERFRPARYSPEHGANFCGRHYRENNQ